MEFIRRTFDEFNMLVFDGQLPPIPFRISRASGFLGMVRCKRERRWNGKWHFYDFEFVVSEKACLLESEDDVEDVILHEMIHYYILSSQTQDSSAHGDIFRRMMNDINARFGRHITISHRSTHREMDKDKRARLHIVGVVSLSSGKRGIIVAAHTRYRQLRRTMMLIPDITDCRWYASNDPFFNRFPRAIKPKVYSISETDLSEHIASARQI